MELFHEITDAQAIVRLPNTVLKQVKVYHRGAKVYVAHAGGFLRVLAKFGDEDRWPTTSPNVSVEDISQDIPGLFVVGRGGPRYVLRGEA